MRAGGEPMDWSLARFCGKLTLCGAPWAAGIGM